MKIIILTLIYASLVAASNFLTLHCSSCYEAGGRQCLLRDSFSYGTCCDPSVAPELQSYFCKGQMEHSSYCATSSLIQNEAMQKFVCP